MAISLVGYSEFSAATTTGSQPVTVPASADFAVAFCGAYGDSSPSLNNPVCTLGSDAFTQQKMLAVSEGSGHNGIAVETLVNPSTGSQTLYWDWGFDPFDNHEIVIAYFSGVDPTTPVVDSAVAGSASVTVPTSGDFIVGGTDAYSGTPDPNQGSQTEITRFTNASGGMGVGYEAGTQTAFQTAGGSWYATAAVTLNEASGGTAVAKARSGVVEALSAPSRLPVMGFEALAPVSAASLAVGEALQGLTSSAVGLNEALRRALSAAQVGFEALSEGLVSRAAAGVIEALGAADSAPVSPLEALHTSLTSAQSVYEGLARALSGVELYLEALGENSVSRSARCVVEASAQLAHGLTVGLEALAQAVSAPEVPIEVSQASRRSAQALLEALSHRALAQRLSLESLARLETAAPLALEAVHRARAQATVALAALSEGVRVATVALEALGAPAAQIALDEISQYEGSASNWQHTLGAGANRVLVVLAGIETTAPTISAVTYAGQALTQGVSEVNDVNRLSLWYALEADLPAPGTYTIAVTHDDNDAGLVAGAISLENVAQSGLEAFASQASVGTANSISTSITPSSGAWVIEGFLNSNQDLTLTPTTGQTQVLELNSAGSISVALAYEAHEAGGQTLETYTSSGSGRLVHVLASLAPAAVVSVPVARAALMGLEALHAVEGASGIPVQALQGVRQARALAIEALQGVRQAGVVNVEAWGEAQPALTALRARVEVLARLEARLTPDWEALSVPLTGFARPSVGQLRGPRLSLQGETYLGKLGP